MRASLAIAAVELRRFLRDRSNIFFAFIMPLLLVLLIGAQFGDVSGGGRVTVAGGAGALRADLVTALEASGVAVGLAEEDAVKELLARGRTDVGIIVPPGAEDAYGADQGLALEVIMGSQLTAQATQQRVSTAVAALTTERGQVAALTDAGLSQEAAGELLAVARAEMRRAELDVVAVDDASQAFEGAEGLGVGAAGQTLLFVFLTSLAGSATLIQTRRYGVMGRTLAAPVSSAQAVTGQVLGRFVIAFLQGAYIMAGTSFLFGVKWGNLGLAALVLAVFAAVSAGAAMVIGSLLDNDNAAGGVGVGLGLILAALGGSMMPLEIFPDTLRTIAHVTPHAWGNEAFAELQRRDGTLLDILPQLGVLAAMAAVLLVLGAWALRRSMARAM